MKAKAIALLIFIVLFITGVSIIGNLIPHDDINLTASYKEGVSVYTPPAVNVVESFDAGNMRLATIGLAGYKQVSSVGGNHNFMATSILEGGWSSVPIVKVDYYSIVTLASGIRYVVSTTDKISFPEGRNLNWGSFSFSMKDDYPLEVADGKIYFPMEYTSGNLNSFLIWTVCLFLNVLVCVYASRKVWKSLEICQNFKFQTNHDLKVQEESEGI